MKRETGFLAIFLTTAAPLMFCQDLQRKPSPPDPAEIIGPQLIAWSQMQKPQPVQQSEQQRGGAANENVPEPAQQQPAAQTLTGTIVKDAGRYVLKADGSNTYELDDQDRAKGYEGKQVKVAGTLSANGNSFHVIRIELIS
jgi:hypothetical protein